MEAIRTNRGFIGIIHPVYPQGAGSDHLIWESSVIGDYENSFDVPGSSFLWVGEFHHLNREEVAELIKRMQYWLDNGRLEITEGDQQS